MGPEMQQEEQEDTAKATRMKQWVRCLRWKRWKWLACGGTMQEEVHRTSLDLSVPSRLTNISCLELGKVRWGRNGLAASW